VKETDEIFSMLCLFALLCFIYLNINMRKTEITEFADPNSKNIFIILNPPEDYNSLRSLILEHFLSFATKDTTKIYYGYHEYYKETWFTHRSYIEERKEYSFKDDYLYHCYEDFLAKVSMEPWGPVIRIKPWE